MTASNTFSIDVLQEEILLDVFRHSLRESGNVDAVSYRAEHETWIEHLNELERRQLLKRENGGYRVTFFVLTLLKDGDVEMELGRCERVFNILREHYKNSSTRHQEKRLINLSEDLEVSYGQIVRTVTYFMDASPLWSGGSNSFNDPESAFIKPSEYIIICKNFEDLVAKVQHWFRPQPTSTNPFLTASSDYKGRESQKERSELHPCPIVTSYLYSLKSDAVVRIVGRVGLVLDWSISKDMAYSDKTRLRVYIPRIEKALLDLSESNRMLVARNVVHELGNEAPEIVERLNQALEKIGWRIADGELTTHDLNIREMFFPSGAEHSAYVQIRNILGGARHSIDVVDPYLDSSIFEILKAQAAGPLQVRLLTGLSPSDFKLEASKFQKEASAIRLEIRTTRDFHDRFIVLDEERCFHVGASIKDAGKRAFMISQLEDQRIAASLISFTLEKWRQATPL